MTESVLGWSRVDESPRVIPSDPQKGSRYNTCNCGPRGIHFVAFGGAKQGTHIFVNWAVLWDVLLFFLFFVFFLQRGFTLIRQHSVQRQAEDMRCWGISKDNFPVKGRRHAVLGANLKSIFLAKMHCWVGGQWPDKKTHNKKNNNHMNHL